MLALIKKQIKKHNDIFLFMKRFLLWGRYISSIFQKDKYSNLNRFKHLEKIIVGENKAHCYFGYYDKSPLSEGNRHLAFLKVPEKYSLETEARVCIYDMQTKTIREIAKTNTWNWQQGCMMNWVEKNTLSFNSYCIENKSYICNWLNVETGSIRRFQRAAYAYNSTHTLYLSLNFYRLDCYAKGYGYRFEEDSMKMEEDGIWETDTRRGEVRQLISLKEIVDFRPNYANSCVHYVNHVCYTPKEDAIIFIHRWQQPGGEFISRLLLMKKDSKALTVLLNNKHVSHYYWKNKTELLIYATNNAGQKGYLLVDIDTGESTLLAGFPSEDGHPSYNQDNRLVVTDTYPNNARKQHLFIYDVTQKELKLLDKLHSPMKFYNEYRCDLHPRWSQDGEYIVVDNTNEGIRTLYLYHIK